ncbi:MAG: PD40 domain-containing protein [Planctomycetes bacterium]|nr:PD40 domain-containing protein [Planctomycetota bacterium]
MIRSSRTTVALGVVAMAAGAFLLIGSALATGRPDRPAADPSVLAVAVQHADVPRIVLLNVSQETTAEVAHPSGANSPAWSPDGKRIACVSLAPGQIFAMNADGTGSVQLTNTAGSEVCPSWSPDGKKIAFTSDRTGNYEVFVMNPDGSDPTNLTDNPAWDADPAWSPDGKSIALASNRTGTFRLWTMNAEGLFAFGP